MTDSSELFRVSAKAVICVQGHGQDRVLLLRTPAGKWDLPGGRLEPGEDIEASLARELVEEMGISIPIGPFIYCSVRRRAPPKQNVVVVAYVCTMDTEPDQIVLSAEHETVRLFSAAEIGELGLVDSYREAIEKAFGHMSTMV